MDTPGPKAIPGLRAILGRKVTHGQTATHGRKGIPGPKGTHGLKGIPGARVTPGRRACRGGAPRGRSTWQLLPRQSSGGFRTSEVRTARAAEFAAATACAQLHCETVSEVYNLMMSGDECAVCT